LDIFSVTQKPVETKARELFEGGIHLADTRPVTTLKSKAVKPKEKIIQILQLLLDVLMHVIETIGAVLLSAMTLIIFWQVITRFKIINVPTPWTEEVALMLLVWFGLAGAAIGIRKESHIGVEFVTALFPTSFQKYINSFVGLLIVVFSVFLFIEGIALAKGTWEVLMSATLLPRGKFVYLAVPTAAALMFVYGLEFVVKQFTAGGKNDD